MKIALVGPAYPLRGGNALFVAHLYDALAGRHQVNVISFSRLYPELLFPGVRQNDISGFAMKQHPSEALIDSVNPFTWMKAARRIVQLNPDILVFTWWNPFFGLLVKTIASAFKRATGRPVVIVAENVVSHEGRWIDLFLTKMALRQADRFIVLSQVVENQIKKLFNKTKVFRSSLPVYDCYQIEDALTSEKAKEQLGVEGKNVILFFGYIRAYKGLMNLIEAFPAVCREVPKAHLLIVGEFYDDPKPYHEAMKNLSIESSVTLVAEYVANEKVHLYFTAADVVVLPYNEATQSGILSIAYGFAKPVIATDVGGLAELVEDGKTGYIVPPHDGRKLSDAIVRYFKEGNEKDFSRNIEVKREKNNFKQIRDVFETMQADLAATP